MQLSTDIIHEICRFDSNLLEWYYTTIKKPIVSADCNVVFLFHLASTDNIHMFKPIFKKLQKELSPHFMNMLFEEAIMCESVFVMTFLLKKHTFPEDIIRNYLYDAIQEKCVSVIPYIFKYYPNLIDSQTLEEAVFRNQYPVVKYILNHPQFEESNQENQAFIIAIQLGHRKIFKYMMKHNRIEPHEPDNTPLKEAIYGGHGWFASELLQHPYVRMNLNLDSEEKQLLRTLIM